MPPATRGRTLYCVFCGGPRDKTSCEKKCLIWPQFLQIPLEIQQNTGRTRTTPSFARTCESRITSILSAVFCRTLCNRAVCCCSVSVYILSAVFCRTLCNLAVCPQPIKNIVTTPSFARTCESRITSNFVPQRAQAG